AGGIPAIRARRRSRRLHRRSRDRRGRPWHRRRLFRRYDIGVLSAADAAAHHRRLQRLRRRPIRRNDVSLRPGKLPAETLARLLGNLKHSDPRVALGPAIGRDAAVIDTGGVTLLVATMDLVTFATEHIGWYAVNVNANH